jgi:hypothetical protein
VKEAFIIYNSSGKSKGMAIVTFHRPGDAAVAKAKYDGKFIDMSTYCGEPIHVPRTYKLIPFIRKADKD